MSDLKVTVTCQRCEAELAHVCNASLAQVAWELFKFTPFLQPKNSNKENQPLVPRSSVSKDDKEGPYPFFSEAYLYPLLGKDDARSVLGRLNRLLEAAGLDPYEAER